MRALIGLPGLLRARSDPRLNEFTAFFHRASMEQTTPNRSVALELDRGPSTTNPAVTDVMSAGEIQTVVTVVELVKLVLEFPHKGRESDVSLKTPSTA